MHNSLIETFADISGHRDRSVIDQSVAQLVHDLVMPRHVAIHRRVGVGAQARWQTVARIEDGREETCPTLYERSFDSLPLATSWPAHDLCLNSGQPVDLREPLPTVLMPLSAGREVAGVLEVASVRSFTLEQRRVLGSMGRFYRNLCTLLDENESDALTGLRNRKSFDESFVRMTYLPPVASTGRGDRRGAGADTRGWLAIIDIDHFKSVNDQFGHLIGDEVLLLLSRLMRESLRFDDQIYRFGGEEFVVLMRPSADTDVVDILEQLRHRVATYPFPQVERITISIGLTRVCEDDLPSDAFDRADQAVYWVKQNGRNQLCAHDQILDQLRTKPVAAPAGIDFF